ncbi:MAG: ferritin-like domain-containing protein [Anaerolineae bacterium]
MDPEKIIAMLHKDMQDEHAAVIQYLQHAYAFGEGELAAELEAIAREEMQHFRWLADIVVRLGGKPSMVRGEVVFAGPKIVDMLHADVMAEQKAIDQYLTHMALIDDPEIVEVLRRIVADERAHMGKFEKYAGEQDPAAEVRMEPTIAEADRPKAEYLQKDLKHEYTVVLQYLAHAFMTPHCEVEHEMEWQAVEEMRHMGWLAEEMESLGTRAEMVHDPLVLPDTTSEMLQADIAIEKEVASEYRRQALSLGEHELADLLERIAGEEDHHVVVFSKLLDEVEEAEKPAQPASKPTSSAGAKPGFTVGSLLGKPQK